MEKTNVLIVGSGAREHAIGWKLAQSPNIGDLFFWPGNAGTAELGKNVELEDPRMGFATQVNLLVFPVEQKIGLVVIGPDAQLAKGVSDGFLKRGLPVFGPTKTLARIEWSKVYAKELMRFLDIPTPNWGAYHSIEGVLHALRTVDVPFVMKKDGLDAGKGVRIFHDHQDGVRWAREQFAQSPDPLLIEQFVPGICEASMLALCDGRNYVLCPPALDYKRVSDASDEMTGGMGCVAPAPVISREYWERIGERVVRPVLDWFYGEDPRGFRGCLYVGLMLTAEGPLVLEYNARPGDPETQAILPILNEDLLELMSACANGKLADRSSRMLEESRRYAVCVTVADKDYPKESRSMIDLPEKMPTADGVYVFQANTRINIGRPPSSLGGRVLSVVGVDGEGTSFAKRRAYGYLDKLSLVDVHWRADIGKDIPVIR